MKKDMISKSVVITPLGVFIFFSALFFLFTGILNKYGDKKYLYASADVLPNTFLPYLLIKENTANFNSVELRLRKLEGGSSYFLFKKDTNYYSVYPLFTGIASVPIYLSFFGQLPWGGIESNDDVRNILFLGRITSGIITACSIALFYYLISKFCQKKRYLIPFTIFYGLGTTTFSVSSLSLWQHTFSQLLITVSLIVLFKIFSVKTISSKYGIFLGVSSGLLLLTRPVDVIFLPFFYLILFLKQRKSLLISVLSFLPFVAIFFGLNLYFYGNILVEGYGARGDLHWTGNLLESVPGLLFSSPARSLLFISPPLLLAFIGFFKLAKFRLFSFALFFGFITFFLVNSKWYTWHGGSGFGYRMLTETLPILGLFSYIIFSKAKGWWYYLVTLLMIYSIIVNSIGVFWHKGRCPSAHNYDYYCLTIDTN